MNSNDLDSLLRNHRPTVRHPGPADGFDDCVLDRLARCEPVRPQRRVGRILGLYWVLAALAMLAVLGGFALPALTATTTLIVGAAVLCVALPFLFLARVARISVLALLWRTLEE